MTGGGGGGGGGARTVDAGRHVAEEQGDDVDTAGHLVLGRYF